MLYIEPVFKIGPAIARRGRFGYADDICQLVISKSLEENTTRLQSIATDLMEWGQREGLTFDLAKTELQHFARGWKRNDPTCSIQTPEGTVEIIPPQLNEATRWLGIWFDRRLKFRIHIQTLAAKAKLAANGIQALANTVRGVKAPLLRQTTIACVVSVLCYGAEAWWPGRHRPRQSISGEQKLVSNGVAAQLACLDQVLRSALRGNLPVYRTTQAAALHRETAIPPIELLLDQRKQALSVRVHQLDTRHPVYRRATHLRNPQIKTRLLRAIDPVNFHNIEHVDPLLTRPWDSSLMPRGRPTAAPRAQAREDFQSWLSSIPQPSLVVYTDGSKEKGSTAAGAGWVGYWGTSRIKIFSGHTKLPNQEIFDAEARAALLGLQAALKNHRPWHATNLYICLDNLEAVQQLQGQPGGSSQSVFRSFQETAQSWADYPRALSRRSTRIMERPTHGFYLGSYRRE